MNKSIAVLAGVVAISLAGGASAAVLHATDVRGATLGTPDPRGEAARYVAAHALGAADGKFYSLGLGGDLTLDFGKTVSGTTEIRVSEVTYSFVNLSRYLEAVDLFALLGGGETLIGRLANHEALAGRVLSYVGSFDGLRFVDVTKAAFPTSPSADGIDIDAVELTVAELAAVPLPASGAILVAGLGAFGLLRRRRR